MTDAVATPEAASDPLRAGRAALARRAWGEAFDLLSQADREGGLSGPDLESLAEAAFFSAHPDQILETKERAFKAYAAANDQLQAAYLALDLAHGYAMRGKTSIAAAWMRRGERLLEGQPEGHVHGYLLLARSEAAKAAGDIDAALAFAQQAVDMGVRTGNSDLNGWALTNLGTLQIANGAASEGLALLEEASIAAVNGELSPFATGVICCTMIAACRDLTDYQRASEWIEQADRYCERQSVAGFPGVCRIHRAEIVALGGAWDRAEGELRQATSELTRFGATPPIADGLYAIGEIRRLQGHFESAESALREAHGLGRSPQPALALIRLAEGKVKAAASAINSAVAEETQNVWARARLLPAQIEIAIAASDMGRARSALAELDTLVSGYPSPALQAGSRLSRGRVLLAEGDPTGAARELRAAVRQWREVSSPYEVAKARALLASALRALEDEDAADLELRAARDEFAKLGAKPDLAIVEREIDAVEQRRAAPAQVRKTLMFTDVVGSTQLAELLGNEAWEALLQWHDRTLRSLVAAGGGEVVNSTGDGFFVAFDSAAKGIRCACEIQRALAEHRRTSGFALPVRIGLHTAQANRRGGDYSGMAVNVASRVAGVAQGGEIVATAEALADAGNPPSTSRREAVLKGVSTPATVATVVWS